MISCPSLFAARRMAAVGAQPPPDKQPSTVGFPPVRDSASRHRKGRSSHRVGDREYADDATTDPRVAWTFPVAVRRRAGIRRLTRRGRHLAVSRERKK